MPLQKSAFCINRFPIPTKIVITTTATVLLLACFRPHGSSFEDSLPRNQKCINKVVASVT